MRHVGEEFRFVAVGRFDLLAFLFDLTEEPRVLNRECGLSREGLEEINDFRRKAARLLPPDG